MQVSAFYEALRFVAALGACALLVLPNWGTSWSGVAVSLQFILVGGLFCGALCVAVLPAPQFNSERSKGDT